MANVKNLESIKFLLANIKLEHSIKKMVRVKLVWIVLLFRRHLQELADNYTRKELLIMAEELNIPVDDIGELSQFEFG